MKNFEYLQILIQCSSNKKNATNTFINILAIRGNRKYYTSCLSAQLFEYQLNYIKYAHYDQWRKQIFNLKVQKMYICIECIIFKC